MFAPLVNMRDYAYHHAHLDSETYRANLLRYSHKARHEQACRNCGDHHPIVLGYFSKDCVMIGTRMRIQRAYGSPPPKAITMTMPMPAYRRQATFFKELWDCFLEEAARGGCGINIANGQSEPLLWLQWKSWNGNLGQTKNKGAFDNLWEGFVRARPEENELEAPVAWLTIRSEVGPSGCRLLPPPSSPLSELLAGSPCDNSSQPLATRTLAPIGTGRPTASVLSPLPQVEPRAQDTTEPRFAAYLVPYTFDGV